MAIDKFLKLEAFMALMTPVILIGDGIGSIHPNGSRSCGCCLVPLSGFDLVSLIDMEDVGQDLDGDD